MKITKLNLVEIKRLQEFLGEVVTRIEAGGNDEVEVMYHDTPAYRSMCLGEAFHPHSQYRLVRMRRERFENIYEDGDSFLYHDLEEANKIAGIGAGGAGLERSECVHYVEVFPGEEWPHQHPDKTSGTKT